MDMHASVMGGALAAILAVASPAFADGLPASPYSQGGEKYREVHKYEREYRYPEARVTIAPSVVSVPASVVVEQPVVVRRPVIVEREVVVAPRVVEVPSVYAYAIGPRFHRPWGHRGRFFRGY